MPPGWLLITLDGAVVAPPSSPAPPRPATRGSSPLVATKSRERTRDLVTSGDIVYDRALLPEGFFNRGVGEADRAWWDDQFYDGLADRDQPRVQALVQGEADRVGDFVSHLHVRMQALGKTEALRILPALMRDVEQAEATLRHVQAAALKHGRR